MRTYLKLIPASAPNAPISVVYMFIFSSLSPYRDFLYHSYLSSPSLLASGYSWYGKYLSVKVVPLSGCDDLTFSSARCRRRRARYVLRYW